MASENIISQEFPTVNQAAFLLATVSAAATVSSIVAVTAAASKVAMVALGILGVTSAGVSIATMTAWLDKSSITAAKYWENVKNHSGIAIVGMYQFVAQTMVQAMVEAFARAIQYSIFETCLGRRE